MARRRTTFGKLERDRAKQAKAKAKIDRRAELKAAEPTEDEPVKVVAPVDDAMVLTQLAELQEAFAAGKVGFDEFEERREALRQSLNLD